MIFQSGTNTDFNSATAFYETSSWEAPITSSNYISASAFIGDGSQLTNLPGGGIFEQTGSFYSTTNNLQIALTQRGKTINIKNKLTNEKSL